MTISGSNFGTAQGGGNVWLGSTYGVVVNWTNTHIVATVAAISTSGTAQVQQGGILSNSVAFNVNVAAVLNVSPASGVPGTQVTIFGSGFGATQGSGQVWLGTANGVAQSWSDTQVIAVVATGSTSGNAQVLQGSVWRNAVPFTVNSLNVTNVTPTSGGPGTSVTITGTGFGSSQGGSRDTSVPLVGFPENTKLCARSRVDSEGECIRVLPAGQIARGASDSSRNKDSLALWRIKDKDRHGAGRAAMSTAEIATAS